MDSPVVEAAASQAASAEAAAADVTGAGLTSPGAGPRPESPRPHGGAGRMVAFGLVLTAVFFVVEHEFDKSTKSEIFEVGDFEEVEFDTAVESGSGLRRVAFVGLGAFGLLMTVWPTRRRVDWCHPLRVLCFALAVYLAISLLWADDAGLAFRRIVVALMCVFGLGGVLRHFSPRETAQLIVGVSATYIVLGLLAELALGTFRPWDGGYRFAGTTHPNVQGIIDAFAIFGALGCAGEARGGKKLLWFGVAAFAVTVLVLTKSRTTLAAAMVAVSALCWLRMSWTTRGLSAVAGLLVASGCLLGVLILDGRGESVVDTVLLGRTEEAATLTGRIPLWTELAGDVAARPIVGHGFGSFWTPDVLYRVGANQGWQIPHAHSGYIETALNLGILGLLMTLSAVIWGLLNAAFADSRDRRMESAFVFCTLTFACVYSLADTGFVLPTIASFTAAACVLISPDLLRLSTPSRGRLT